MIKGIALSTIILSLSLPLPTVAAGERNEPRDSSQTMAERASRALMQARKMDVPDWRATNDLIFQERFSEFEERSRHYESQFKVDPLYESPLFKLYNILGGQDGTAKVSDAQFQAALAEWIATRPSYMSYSARGLYLVNLGFEQRGGEVVRDTPPQQIALMRGTHAAARADLLRALKENPKFPIPYIGLIRLEQASGSIEDATKWIIAANKEIPYAYYVRSFYLQSLTPRWGGSYELMESYVSTLDEAARGNPRIWSLKGEPHAERGYSSVLAKDYQSAINHYTKALAYGDRREFYYWRAHSYKNLNRKQQAIADYSKCLEITGPDKDIENEIRVLSR